MTNGTIAGSYFGISNTGTMVITGGSISGSTRGINNNGTLTLGDASSPVRTDSPIVHATKTSYGYGFDNSSTATFNFYDGIIKSSSGSNYSINGTVNNIPSGYTVYKEVTSGIESAYLKH